MKSQQAGSFAKKSGRMTFSPEHLTAKMEPDVRTSSVLEAIANTLNGDIQMESDVPSSHDSGRLPVLDLEMFITGRGWNSVTTRNQCSAHTATCTDQLWQPKQRGIAFSKKVYVGSGT